ncbi:MAG: thermonuclease family protein, partial [Victivallaceae bacterium]
SGVERPGKDFEPKEFKAVVINVYDGDTVTVVNDKDQKYKIRLWGIDAPEMAQDGGQSSQRYLKNLIDSKEVDIIVKDVDKYSRLLAVIYQGDRMINGEMVLAGHAWWYENFAPNAVDLANYEQEARKYQRGLWRQKNPTPPWKFRQK